MKQHRPPTEGSRRRALSALGGAGALALAAAFLAPSSAPARDTDVYSQASGQNIYILLDASGSMGGAVYDHSVDYGRLYDWYMNLSGADLARVLEAAKSDPVSHNGTVTRWADACAGGGCKVVDVKSVESGFDGENGKGFVGHHFERDHLYLLDRAMAVRITRLKQRDDGSAVPADSQHPDDFSDMPADWYRTDNMHNVWGNPGRRNGLLNPDTLYNGGSPNSSHWMADTNTALVNGELVLDYRGKNATHATAYGRAQRLTVDNVQVSKGGGETVTLENIVLLDGMPMPFSQMTTLHSYRDMPMKTKEGEVIRGTPRLNAGLAGALTAPG